MRLPETDPAVNEQRVIRARRCLRDGETCGMRNFVVRTDHERFKRVPWIESGDGCAWLCVAWGFQQNFFQRRAILRSQRIRSRKGGKLYRARIAKRGDNGSLQRRHIITLDPKLIDIVWNGESERFVFGLDQLDGRKPALETIGANLRLERSR